MIKDVKLLIENVKKCLQLGYTENFLLESMDMKDKGRTLQSRVKLLCDVLEGDIKSTKQYAEELHVTSNRISQYYVIINRKMKWLIGYYNQYGYLYQKGNKDHTVNVNYL